MATLRNLRNLLQAQVSVRHIGKVCKYMADPAAVAKSKQLPFRFLAAYRELQAVPSANVTLVLNALEEAVCAAAQNIKGFDEQTSVLVVCDVSGSMQKPISARSSIQLFDIGLILGMLLQSRCKRVMSGMFGDTWKVINMPSKNILSNVQEYYKREGEVGYATNGHLAIEYLMKKKLRMDKVMCFTDCQLWNNKQYGTSFQRAWNDYKAFHPAAQLYIFDLAGYGNTPVSVNAQDVYLVAGWSDKIFDVLQAIQEGGSALEKIKEVVL